MVVKKEKMPMDGFLVVKVVQVVLVVQETHHIVLL